MIRINRKIRFRLLAGLLLCSAAGTAGAQPAKKAGGARAAFVEGDNTLGLSLGLIPIYSYASGATNLPAFSVWYDRGILNDVGPGTIGVGGVIGVQTSYYRHFNGDRDSWSSFIFGVRGTYHLTLLKDKNNKFDPYGGLTVGMRAEQYTVNYTGTRYYDSHGGANPFVGIFIGAKYNFSRNIGAFAELGNDISFFRIGIHFNF